MIKVYIASPYTAGDTATNVKVQMDMADRLMTLGYAPYAPLLSHFLHMANPRPYQDWIEHDLEFVEVCDCVLRLEGVSPGADKEVYFAHHECGKPVFYDVESLEKHYKKEVQ